MWIEIGSFIISIIAISISLGKEFFIPLIFKPKLDIIVKNDDFCVQFGGFNNDSLWLRIILINKDGYCTKSAINCYIKFLEIRNSRGDIVGPFDAFPLEWAQYKASNKNLAKGEYHILGLVHEFSKERVLRPTVPIGYDLYAALWDDRKTKLGPDKYTLKLGVYGDNFEPIIKEIKVILTDTFGELRFDI